MEKEREEIATIHAMIFAADEYHLVPEVVLALANIIRQTPNINMEEACLMALQEWDI